MRSERVIDVDWAPARVFAVLSDPRRVGEWSTLFGPGSAAAARAWSTGDRLELRWTWCGRDEMVDAHLELAEEPFALRWEGKTEDGTRFEVWHGIAAHDGGSRVDVVVDVEPASNGVVADDGALQRVLDRDVERMTARLFALIDRYDTPADSAGTETEVAPTPRSNEPPGPVTSAGGRPLHRAVAPFTLAVFALTLVADMWYSLHETTAAADVARSLAVAAAALALFTGVVGAVDFVRRAAARRVPAAWLHGLGNVGVVALAVANAARRVHDPVGAIQPWGLVTSSLIVAIAVLTWWAGRTTAARAPAATPTSRAPLDGPGMEAGGRE